MKKHMAWILSFLLAAGCVLPVCAEESEADLAAQGSWQDAYCDFVFDTEYLVDEDAHYGDSLSGGYDNVSFALRDMNKDGTPELIIFNGDEVYAGSVDYVYQYKDGDVSRLGMMPGSNYNRFICVDEPDLPGIFCSGAHTGAYWTDYYSFDGTELQCENVWAGSDIEFDTETGETILNTDPDTGDVVPKEAFHTEDETLYKAWLMIDADEGGSQLPFYTLGEIRQMGWESFQKKYEIGTAGSSISSQDAENADAGAAPEEILSSVPDHFYFSSGAGGWGTDMILNDDGTFTGSYHDSNMGEDIENYPNGTVYVCNFSGSFTDFQKVDDYTWSMRLASLDYEKPVGEDWSEEGAHYIASDAYGLSGGDLFYLYLPGHPVDTLPEEYMSWANMYMGFEEPEALTIYGIYNVNEQEGWGGYN